MIRSRWGGARALLVTALAVVVGASALPALGQQTPKDASTTWSFQGESGVPADLDVRDGVTKPSAAQKELVRSLGATATWNDFGTPQSLIANDGYLATGLGGSDAAAARAFITKNRSLFRLPRGR